MALIMTALGEILEKFINWFKSFFYTRCLNCVN